MNEHIDTILQGIAANKKQYAAMKLVIATLLVGSSLTAFAIFKFSNFKEDIRNIVREEVYAKSKQDSIKDNFIMDTFDQLIEVTGKLSGKDSILRLKDREIFKLKSKLSMRAPDKAYYKPAPPNDSLSDSTEKKKNFLNRLNDLSLLPISEYQPERRSEYCSTALK